MLSKNDTQTLKGIAILVVMFGHLVTVHHTTFPTELRWTASFGVTIFLLLSGYGLVKSFDASGLSGFFNKRFTTVYIPFSIVTVAVALLNGSHFSNLRDVIKTLTFTNLNMNIDPTLWYIYFIAIWYVLFYFTFRFIKTTFADN